MSGTITRSGLSARWLSLKLGCEGTIADVCRLAQGSAPPLINISGGAITLLDESSPTVSNVRGSLLAPGPKTGVVTAQAEAADLGSGLYRLLTFIDGKQTNVQSLAHNDANCSDVSPSGEGREFVTNVPCPLDADDLIVAINTNTLSDGNHAVQAFVEDAAGNRTPMFETPQLLRVTKPGPAVPPVSGEVPPPIVENTVSTVLATRMAGVPNGVGADVHARLKLWFVKTRTPALASSTFGQRQVIRGRLVDRDGKGIRGARIRLQHLVGGKRVLLKTGVRTRGQGKITLILPMNLYGDKAGWRKLKFDYTAFIPGKPVAVKTLKMRIIDRSGKPVNRMLSRNLQSEMSAVR